MSKRPHIDDNICNMQGAKKVKHWSLGLLEAMKDPEQIVKQTEKAVVIRDKYPKAKLHYLVVAEENINTINDLNRSHISLLEEFRNLYEDLKKGSNGVKFRAGFHAVPSMRRLHMHVISTDMISPYLKTKIHWNSFTTKFFLPLDEVIEGLKKNGFIKKMDSADHKSIMSSSLKCNQCSYLSKNMPDLKDHLLTHTNIL